MIGDREEGSVVTTVDAAAFPDVLPREARPTTKLHKSEILGVVQARRAMDTAPSVPLPKLPRRGDVLLDKYRVESLIGTGGMSNVIKAHHMDLDRPVALKCIKRELLDREAIVERFLREARASVRLKGEHVAHVYDIGKLPDGTLYLVMEYLDGADIDAVLTQGPFDPPHAVDLFVQACAALAEAHALGIVHRDIKPSNLFITELDRVPPVLKVLDFGLASAPRDEAGDEVGALTGVHTLVGTPAYMSPEQMRSAHEVDARSDIWSLGCVLYQMLEGARPFRATQYSELCLKIGAEPFEPMQRANVPAGLAAVIAKCLEKRAADRFGSIAELALAVAPFAFDKVRARAVAENCVQALRRSSPEAAAALPRRQVASTFLGIGPDPTAELRTTRPQPSPFVAPDPALGSPPPIAPPAYAPPMPVDVSQFANWDDGARVIAAARAATPPLGAPAYTPESMSLVARLAAHHAGAPTAAPQPSDSRTVMTEAVAPLPKPSRRAPTEEPRRVAEAAAPRAPAPSTRSRAIVIAATVLVVVGIGAAIAFHDNDAAAPAPAPAIATTPPPPAPVETPPPPPAPPIALTADQRHALASALDVFAPLVTPGVAPATTKPRPKRPQHAKPRAHRRPDL